MQQLILCLHSPTRMRSLLEGQKATDLFWLGVEHWAIWSVVEAHLRVAVSGSDDQEGSYTGKRDCAPRTRSDKVIHNRH